MLRRGLRDGFVVRCCRYVERVRSLSFRSWITTVQALRGNEGNLPYSLFIRLAGLNERVRSDLVPKTWGNGRQQSGVAVAQLRSGAAGASAPL